MGQTMAPRAAKKNPTETITPMDQALSSYTLTEDEKLVREGFVKQYMLDFDAVSAAIRIGFQATFAIEWAKRMMGEPYVQLRIMQERHKLTEVSDEEDKAAWEANLRYLMHHGPEASRTNATKMWGEYKKYLAKDAGGGGDTTALEEAMRELSKVLPV